MRATSSSGTVTLLPGQPTKAHVHHHESAHYISGDAVELWTGHRLELRSVARPGDYLFIPAGLPPHKPEQAPPTVVR